MQRPFRTFIGVDLGGGKGKNTAVARLVLKAEGIVEVHEVGTAWGARGPWYDDALLDYIALHGERGVVAVDAPLTLPACIRCREASCPGAASCADPAVAWFRTAGAELIAESARNDRERIAVIPRAPARTRNPAPAPAPAKPLATPYTQRATEVILHRRHGIVPRETLGQGMGPLTARAAYLVRAMARLGFGLNENLIEVYPKATLHRLLGERIARKYKREVGTWEIRARVLESMRGQLEFARESRLGREECLRNDHCFDALACAYTAFMWARDGWTMPEEHADIFAVDGWIWTP